MTRRRPRRLSRAARLGTLAGVAALALPLAGPPQARAATPVECSDPLVATVDTRLNPGQALTTTLFPAAGDRFMVELDEPSWPSSSPGYPGTQATQRIFERVYTSVQVTFATPGVHTVKLCGPVTQVRFTAQAALTSVETFGNLPLTNLDYSFARATNLTSVPATLPSASRITRLDHTFQGATRFDGDLSGWDVSAVGDLTSTFQGASRFNGNVSSWDTSSAVVMRNTFDGATSFNRPLAAWNMAKVTDASRMLAGATAFNQPIGTWDLRSATTIAGILDGARSFDQPLGGWRLPAVTTTAGLERAFAVEWLSNANTDSLFTGLAAQPLPSGPQAAVSIELPGSHHSSSTNPAIDVLERRGWYLRDGGEVAPPTGLRGQNSNTGNDVFATDGIRSRAYHFWGTAPNQGDAMGSMLAGVTALAQVDDITGDRRPDMVTRDRAGVMYLRPGLGGSDFTAARRIGVGFQGFDQITYAGRLGTSGARYLLARRTSDGTLWRFTLSATGLSGGVRIGGGWGAARMLVSVGDKDSDGRSDLLMVRRDGTLWAYLGTTVGTIGAGRQVGGGWGAMTRLLSPGDLTGGMSPGIYWDGRLDLVALRSDGTLWVYGNKPGGWMAGRQLASGLPQWPVLG